MPQDGTKNLIPAQKGEVRNPAGRPKGSKNRSTIVKKWLETLTQIPEEEDGETDPRFGKKKKAMLVDQMTLAVIDKALKGDVQAYKELLDSAYGKVTEQVENKHTFPEGPVNLSFESQGAEPTIE